MSSPHSPSAAPRMPRRQALATLLAAAGVVVLPACGGGGGGTASVDTGGTGSFSTGRISGFGSVIVNGVRFEDNAARLADDDDEAKVLVRDDLKLGMVVTVQGGAITAGNGDILPSATATAISVESQIKGPVESKTGTDTLVVFGQQVKVDAATVFEPGVTFANIVVTDVLEVHGFADAAGVVTASRIERENGANEFKVRGFISNLTATTFQIGSATFNFSTTPAADLRVTPANGLFVRVRTQTVRNGSGQWVVKRIDPRRAFEDRNEAEIEGILVQSGSTFTVNGITINTSRLPAGTAMPVGQHVEVEGSMIGGVLFARKIEIEDENGEAEVDVTGQTSSVNTTGQTFVVRGLTFHYSGATQVDGGSLPASLRDGLTVRVRGTLPSSGTGTIEATRIDFTP